MKSNKSHRIKISLKWLYRIFQKKIFWPHKVKKWNLYTTFYKIKFFKISKSRKYAVEPCLNIWHAKFQVDISVFGKHIAQKPYPWMTSLFQIAILSISRHRTGIKMTFLESWDQTDSETRLFLRNLFENLTLCGPVLIRPFSVFGSHGVRLQNGLDF